MTGIPGLPVQHGDDEAAVGAVKPVDGGHVFIADGEVEQLEVLLDAGGRHRLRDDRHAALNLHGKKGALKDGGISKRSAELRVIIVTAYL